MVIFYLFLFELKFLIPSYVLYLVYLLLVVCNCFYLQHFLGGRNLSLNGTISINVIYFAIFLYLSIIHYEFSGKITTFF